MKIKLLLVLFIAMAKTLLGQTENDFIVENYGNGVTIKAYTNSTIKDVTIPSSINGKSVVCIGYASFRNRGITSVFIPKNVMVIGWLAFEGNPLLTNVTIEDNSNLRVIANQAFDYRGSALTKIKLPTNRNSNFEGYIDVNGVVHNDGTEITNFDIGYVAKIPYTLKEEDVIFENGEIKGFVNFTEKWITIPNNFNGKAVTSIGKAAFYNRELYTNYLVANVTLPNTITIIGYEAFRSNELMEITIPKTVQKIEESAFEYNDIKRLSFESASQLRTIESNAFCSNEIDSLFIPKSVETIGAYAFYFWFDLTKLTFEEGSNLKQIGESAFWNNALSKITIPKNVTSIGKEAFRSSQLSEVKFEEKSIIQFIGEKAFLSSKLSTFTIPVPSKLGYTFDNWYYGKGSVVSNYTTSDKDSSFAAIFNINTYNISYYNLGKFNNPNSVSTYTIESNPITLTALNKKGYDFRGWFNNIEKTDTVSTPAIPKGSIGAKFFYAKWNIIEYKITYHNVGTVRNNNPNAYTVEDAIRLNELNSYDSTNYVFVGWFVRNYYYGNYYTEKSIDSISLGSIGDIEIYAKWLPDGDEVFKTSNFSISSQSPTCRNFADGAITIKTELFDLNVSIQEKGENYTVKKGDIKIVNNLIAGTYHLRIKVTDGVERNFIVKVIPLSEIKSSAVIWGNSVSFNIEGGVAPYNVQIGSEIYTTETGKLTVNHLKSGSYSAFIQDKNSCTEDAKLSFDIERFNVYPNPVNGGVLYVALPTSLEGERCVLSILTRDGRTIITKDEVIVNMLSIDVRSLEANMYILQVISNEYINAIHFIVE